MFNGRRLVKKEFSSLKSFEDNPSFTSGILIPSKRKIPFQRPHSLLQTTPTTYITTSSMNGKGRKRKASSKTDNPSTKKRKPASDLPKKDMKKNLNFGLMKLRHS
jgi:hypothetical protein